YRLLPVRGWHLLLAKDAAFLAVVIALTLPLAVFPGIGAALVALAVGHAPANALAVFQRRRPRQRGDSGDRPGHDGFRHLLYQRLVYSAGAGGVGTLTVVGRTRSGARAGVNASHWRRRTLHDSEGQ